MFERFSEKARRVIFFARYEASQFGSPSIGTEHLLLGILRESHDLISLVAGPDAVKKIVERIQQELPIKDTIPTHMDLPLTEAAQRVLHFAVEEADRLGDAIIAPEHILHGLLREENCLAQKVLAEEGVTLESARQKADSRLEEAAIVDSFGMRVTGKPVPNQEIRKVVMDAINEASLLSSTSTKPEHLLLALLRDESSLAAKILREAGLDYDGVRGKLERD
jgi:ATP-dependent Clp protease ATP-binding subunit ClpC